MSRSIDTVFVWVTDLDRAVDWYRRLGIEPGPRHGAWQAMDTGGATRFALHQGSRRDGPPTAVAAFAVGDLDAELQRLSGLGMSPVDEITDTGAARFATFADPDGNHLQLLERRADKARGRSGD